MVLINQTFYAIFLIFGIGKGINSLIGFKSQEDYFKIYLYWTLAIASMCGASFLWIIIPIASFKLLPFASTLFFSSVLLMTLLFSAINQSLSKRKLYITAILISLVLLGQLYFSYDAHYLNRLRIVSYGLVSVTSWLLYELIKLIEKDKSIYIKLILLVGSIQLLFMIARIYGAEMNGRATFVNIYDETGAAFFIRIMVTASYGMQFLFIGNYFYEKLWIKNIEASNLVEKKLLDVTGEGVWDWNILTGEVKHNQAWVSMLKESHDKTFFTVDEFKAHIHPHDLKAVMDAIDGAIIENREFRQKYRMVRGDGSMIWVEDKGVVLERTASGEATRMVGFISDITEERNAQERIHDLIFFDQLTSLPNRKYIQDRVERCLNFNESKRNTSISGLMYLDLDGFKYINDTFGHRYGDMLLIEFGLSIQKIIRPMDMLARIGGDEYLILFEQIGQTVDEAQAALKEAAKRILNITKSPIKLDQKLSVSIKVSMGIAILGEEFKNFEYALKCVDIAMYSAKNNNQQKYQFFDEHLKIIFERKAAIINGLATASNSHQFFILFQPVVDREKKCIGYEALARWEHPKLGLIMPDEFIQIAERDGLIIEIGDVIFRLILSQFHSQVIAKYGRKFKLMLNASVHQMMHARFSDVFASLCMEHDVPLDIVEIEITETAFLSNPEDAARTMRSLETHGVKFSLDDFGTGFSSLNFLQKVPVNTLKIDKEFISKIDPDGENIILDNIMSLARSLSVNVVAEGVENEDQFNVLYAKGCQYFQGWYFGRPSKTIE